MPLVILLALIAVPLIELTIFVEVGQEIGALPVVALTVFTAVAGMALVRAQGLHTLRRAQQELQHARAPVAEILHGALLVAAGLFLLVPGFLTDFVGALLLVPPLRRQLVLLLLRHFQPSARDVVVEGEYWEASWPENEEPRRLDEFDDRRR